ncbi:MAG: hypothetical protein ACTSRZ_07845 [Promethearchaeota archaeon]
MSSSSKYRSANIIIQEILENIIRASEVEGGIIKSHLINKCKLKVATADKYLQKLESAEYIEKIIDSWGERNIIKYKILPKGYERYKWFVKINTELG